MTNHLMGGHAFATALTLGAHPCQSVEHFVAVGGVEESFHFGRATLHGQIVHGEELLYHSIGLSPDESDYPGG